MKYISPGSWFSLEYPNDWREFEDEEDSFLFYNPEKWNGNFRISAYRGKSAKYAQDCMADELQQNQSARREQAGPWACVGRNISGERCLVYVAYLADRQGNYLCGMLFYGT